EVGEPLKTWLLKFQADKYSALFHLGFVEKESWFSPALEHLHHIAELLIRKLGQQTDLELSRETVQVELHTDETNRLIEGMPFVIGMEYVDESWITRLWEAMLTIFRKEIKDY